MGDNAALCLRFDLDTFSTRHAYTADVGWGAYPYLARILRVAGSHGARLQFCACGQGVEEYPFEIQSIHGGGHSIDSHLYTHRVMLTHPALQVVEELVLTEQAFSAQRIPWSGIGAPGMYVNGIEDCPEVQEALVDRGYQWCSTKYNRDLPLEEMQPTWLNEWLLEIPCAGVSDRGYFRDEGASIQGFLDQVLGMLDEAKQKGLVYAIDLHPGVLAKNDPECEFVTRVLAHADEIGVPVVTMDKVSQWQIAVKAVEAFARGERDGELSAYWQHEATPEGQAAEDPPSFRRYLDVQTMWDRDRAQPQAPEKHLDYVGGWRTFPNVQRNGIRINRFGLRGGDCKRRKTSGVTRILCIGDSCVFGAPQDDGPWPAQLQLQMDRRAPLKFEALNAGIGGQRSANMYLRLPRLIRLLDPDVVLISILANDAWGTNPGEGVDLHTFRPLGFVQNVQAAIDCCRRYEIPPILITPPGMVPSTLEMTPAMLLGYHQAGWLGPEKQPDKMRLLYDRYNEALRDLARDNEIPCIDTAAAFDEELDDRRGQLFGDTCHMLKEGNAEMGRIIADGLLKILT